MSLLNLSFLFIFSTDLETIWDALVTGRPMFNPAQPLELNSDNFASKDAVISLDQFVRFWYVRVINNNSSYRSLRICFNCLILGRNSREKSLI